MLNNNVTLKKSEKQMFDRVITEFKGKPIKVDLDYLLEVTIDSATKGNSLWVIVSLIKT
jgi:hypothetical protein